MKVEIHNNAICGSAEFSFLLQYEGEGDLCWYLIANVGKEVIFTKQIETVNGRFEFEWDIMTELGYCNPDVRRYFKTELKKASVQVAEMATVTIFEADEVRESNAEVVFFEGIKTRIFRSTPWKDEEETEDWFERALDDWDGA